MATQGEVIMLVVSTKVVGWSDRACYISQLRRFAVVYEFPRLFAH